MLFAQGKVNSPLQCPGHHQGSELRVAGTFQVPQPTETDFLKKECYCVLLATVRYCRHYKQGSTQASYHNRTKHSRNSQKREKALPAVFSAAGYFQDLVSSFLIQSRVTKSPSSWSMILQVFPPSIITLPLYLHCFTYKNAIHIIICPRIVFITLSQTSPTPD